MPGESDKQPSPATPIPLGPLLNGSMDVPNAAINFKGCNVAQKDSNGNNIVQATSNAVQDVPVSGSSAETRYPWGTSTFNHHDARYQIYLLKLGAPMMTRREKLTVLGQFVLTVFVLGLGLGGVMCVRWHQSPLQSITLKVLAIASAAAFSLYWFLWVWLSETQFHKYKCFFCISCGRVIGARSHYLSGFPL